MSMRFRGLLFSCIAMVALIAPQISLATKICWNASTGTGGTSWNISFGSSSCSSVATPYGLPGGSILNIVSTFVNWLLALFGILGILGFVISGIMYLISAGNEDMAKTAKAGLKYSIIGIIVGLSGYVVMQAVDGLLQGMGGDGY